MMTNVVFATTASPETRLSLSRKCETKLKSIINGKTDQTIA